ncbi:DUF58 domain-containing protein [Ruicaihuangia caeni]|uniref:DUF58 domain-containing protein n=1 Tax=Ruicaihuangia caeni TaxID=3042517 RepID=A0AAW6T893_9MICO|nr:DUF58 domain-containing protein [Klugiella sp. YN-L-19]MDI2099444.1 DUF58 domain-containing protein [Klugiella sp. YN-L-19]
MAVSGWLVLLVAAGIVPVVLLDAPVVLWWWLLGVVVLIAIDLLLAASPRALRFERELPARTRLGESVTARLLITNPARRTLRGVVRDAWQPSAGALRTRHRITVPAGERRAVETQLRPFRRGERRAEHVTVRSFGPLRLAARQATVAVTGALRVLPPFASRKHLPSRLARLRELDGRTSVMIRGQGTEFDSLREYVRGDDVRSIDWRATARRTDPTGAQKLVVRTWRPERDRRVVIVVDTGRLSAARVGDEPRIDTAFESSLLLGALASHAGDRVDLVMVDRRVRGRVQGATGAELLARMVEAMTPVEPELIETDWAAVPGIVRSVTTQRALVVLLTTIDGVGSSRSLLSVLPQLTEKHLVMVASVSDPAEVEAARQRGDAREVYRAAAAERSLLDAGRVAAAINRLGGEVVLGAPSELPPAVADRYLALKAAGRL